jgi:hypothetical protein
MVVVGKSDIGTFVVSRVDSVGESVAGDVCKGVVDCTDVVEDVASVVGRDMKGAVDESCVRVDACNVVKSESVNVVGMLVEGAVVGRRLVATNESVCVVGRLVVVSASVVGRGVIVCVVVGVVVGMSMGESVGATVSVVDAAVVVVVSGGVSS